MLRRNNLVISLKLFHKDYLSRNLSATRGTNLFNYRTDMTDSSINVGKSSSTTRAVLCDIHGVLFDNDDFHSYPIAGSVDAFNRLVDHGMAVRLVSNESSCSPQAVLQKCEKLGIKVKLNQLFTPAPVAVKILTERNLRPFVIVHDRVSDYFANLNQTNPNCVLVGDAVNNFNFANLNKAFRIMMANPDTPLFSMGMGRFYRMGGGGKELNLDVGPFSKALEYAAGNNIEIVGKPSKYYFDTVLQDLGVKAEETIMIGDDVVSDVGGSQNAGLKGVLVRTGKYRKSDESHPSVTPYAIVDDLKHAVDLIIQQKL